MLQNDTKSLVPIAYFDIFSLRLLGMTYTEIADKTGYSESHVRRLFAKNGAMHDIWESYRKEAKEGGIDDAITMMFGNLPDITRALIERAKGSGRGAVEAGKIIMHYTLGKPPEKVNLKAEVHEDIPISKEEEEQILNAFRNFGILKEDDKGTTSETLNR